MHLHSQWPRTRAGASWPAGGGAERLLRPLGAQSWSFRLAAEPGPLLRMRGRSPPALRSGFSETPGAGRGRAREDAGSRGEDAGGGRKRGPRDTEGGRKREEADVQLGIGFASGTVRAEEHNSRWKKNFYFHL